MKPVVLVTMGRMAYRAVVRALDASSNPRHPPLRLTLTSPPLGAETGGYASPFIRTPRLKAIAAAILTRAARLAGITP